MCLMFFRNSHAEKMISFVFYEIIHIDRHSRELPSTVIIIYRLLASKLLSLYLFFMLISLIFDLVSENIKRILIIKIENSEGGFPFSNLLFFGMKDLVDQEWSMDIVGGGLILLWISRKP